MFPRERHARRFRDIWSPWLTGTFCPVPGIPALHMLYTALLCIGLLYLLAEMTIGFPIWNPYCAYSSYMRDVSYYFMPLLRPVPECIRPGLVLYYFGTFGNQN